MIAARNKKIPLYDEYLSLSELETMYNHILILKGVDYRIFATVIHLIAEIAFKKMCIYHGLKISATSHNISAPIIHLQKVRPNVSELYQYLVDRNIFVYLQKFPYDDLRFNNKVRVTLPNVDFLDDLTNFALRELRLVEEDYRQQLGI